MKRVMIVGSSGSGKSTLARQLGEITGLPVFHTDHIYWKSGWVRQSKQKALQMVGDIAQQPEWVFEGAFSSSYDLRLARADTLIVLDLPTRVCLFRVLKRIISSYGTVRPDMAPGCPDQFDWEFLKWVYRFRRNSRPRLLKLLEDAPPEVTRYHLTSSGAVKALVEGVGRGLRPTE